MHDILQHIKTRLPNKMEVSASGKILFITSLRPKTTIWLDKTLNSFLFSSPNLVFHKPQVVTRKTTSDTTSDSIKLINFLDKTCLHNLVILMETSKRQFHIFFENKEDLYIWRSIVNSHGKPSNMDGSTYFVSEKTNWFNVSQFLDNVLDDKSEII